MWRTAWELVHHWIHAWAHCAYPNEYPDERRPHRLRHRSHVRGYPYGCTPAVRNRRRRRGDSCGSGISAGSLCHVRHDFDVGSPISIPLSTEYHLWCSFSLWLCFFSTSRKLAHQPISLGPILIVSSRLNGHLGSSLQELNNVLGCAPFGSWLFALVSTKHPSPFYRQHPI